METFSAHTASPPDRAEPKLAHEFQVEILLINPRTTIGFSLGETDSEPCG